MISQANIQTMVQGLDGLSSHELKIEGILKLFLDIFPVRNAFLLRYSPFGFIGEGIISIDEKGIDHIRDIRDDIRSIPGIYAAIRERKARFISKKTYLQEVNNKYIDPINSLLVVPIHFGYTVVGYICSSVFEENTHFDEPLLSACTYYGKLVGQIMETSTHTSKSVHLSRRELEVMRKVANGSTMKEMADAMGIGEVTVKQYVNSAMKKLGAQNRAHAVAELFRNGMIT